jgi:beta-glucosidase
MTVPSDFTWGVATASYQIEGSPRADGKGVSIWDTFVRQPGTILDGQSGDLACDSYRRWRDDLHLLRELGVDSYRFSIAWPRVLPFGRGEPNEAGLASYERMVDDLLAAGIEPTVTLFHWDLPQALQDRGGWTDRATAEAFADYAEVCFARLGDRVTRWLTLNEPFVFVVLGHLLGVHAPGIADVEATARATHHALLAHGLAVQRFRDSAAIGRIGLANAEVRIEAGVDEPGVEDAVEAARNLRTRLMLDPLAGRGHNEAYQRLFEELTGSSLPVVDGDLEVIASPIDELGINLYTRELVGPPGEEPLDGLRGYRDVPADGEHTEMGWEVRPQALGDHLRWLDAEYPGLPPLLVTENGMADDATPDDGVVDDPRRIAFLQGYLDSLEEAIADGVDVRGYFVWTLVDNFEWAEGFTKRFGLVWMDHASGRRIPKASFAYYRDVIARARQETRAR